MGLENPLHLAVLALILLLLFGAKRLPDLGRSLGSGIRQFKGSLDGDSGAAADRDELSASSSAAAAPSPTKTG